MVKLADESVFDKLDHLDSSNLENCGRGVKLSRITAKLKDTINFMPLLGKFQQLGFLKIIYDSSRDDEPLVQITEKGKQEAIELLFPGDLKPGIIEKSSDQKPSLACEKHSKN